MACADRTDVPAASPSTSNIRSLIDQITEAEGSGRCAMNWPGRTRGTSSR
jgi:hypothetical protein